MSSGRRPASPITLAAEDGLGLAATLHEPGGTPRAWVVINSGTGIRRRFYDRFAGHLAARGLAAVTWDYRGIGDSRPRTLRGFEARMRDWALLDMAGVLASVRQRAGGAPVVVVGHSAGGHLTGLVPAPRQPDALVLVAAQSGYWGHWPRDLQWRMRLLWRTMPWIASAFGRLPGWLGIGEDLPRPVAAEWSRWSRSPGYLFDDATLDRSGYAAFQRPLLALSFADDRGYAPRPAVEALLARFEGAQVEHRHVDPAREGHPPVGHFGFFKPPAEALWPGVSEWILAQLPRQPELNPAGRPEGPDPPR